MITKGVILVKNIFVYIHVTEVTHAHLQNISFAKNILKLKWEIYFNFFNGILKHE